MSETVKRSEYHSKFVNKRFGDAGKDDEGFETLRTCQAQGVDPINTKKKSGHMLTTHDYVSLPGVPHKREGPGADAVFDMGSTPRSHSSAPIQLPLTSIRTESTDN